MEGITVRLSDGFELTLDPDALNDAEILDDLERVDAGEAWVAVRVLRKILGNEGKKRLYDHIRNPETGRVTYDAVGEALRELFQAPEIKK